MGAKNRQSTKKSERPISTSRNGGSGLEVSHKSYASPSLAMTSERRDSELEEPEPVTLATQALDEVKRVIAVFFWQIR